MAEVFDKLFTKPASGLDNIKAKVAAHKTASQALKDAALHVISKYEEAGVDDSLDKWVTDNYSTAGKATPVTKMLQSPFWASVAKGIDSNPQPNYND